MFSESRFLRRPRTLRNKCSKEEIIYHFSHQQAHTSSTRNEGTQQQPQLRHDIKHFPTGQSHQSPKGYVLYMRSTHGRINLVVYLAIRSPSSGTHIFLFQIKGTEATASLMHSCGKARQPEYGWPVAPSPVSPTSPRLTALLEIKLHLCPLVRAGLAQTEVLITRPQRHRSSLRLEQEVRPAV